MPDLGYSGGFTNYADQNSSYGNQFATELVTAPCDMWVTEVYWYAAGDGGAVTMTWCLWDSADNLLTNGGPQSVPAGSLSVNGQQWNSQASGFLIKSGQQMRPGFWWSSGGAVWSYSTSISGLANTSAVSSPSNLTSTTTTNAGIGAYLVYFQVYPPLATTNAATSVAQTTVTLNGQLTTGNLDTTYYWQWGLSTAYGSSTTSQDAGSGGGTIVVSQGLAGLTAGTTYHTRLVATNADGTAYGADVVFTTTTAYSAPYAPTLTTPTNSSYADVASGETFSPVYNSSDGQNQNAYAFRIKLSGATSYSYYNAGTNALQSSIIWNSSSIAPGASFSATLPSGSISDGNTYNWSFASQEAGANLQGPFASDFTLVAEAGPALSVNGPSGNVTASQPIISWTATPASGSSIISWEAKVFSAAQYTAGGFNPATSATTWDSGVTSGSATSVQVGTALPAGITYRFYVEVTETGSISSSWVYSTATVVADLPVTPTLTATVDATNASVVLTVQTNNNLLSAVDASFETGTGTWGGTNCTVAQSSTHALDGTSSLLVTPSASGFAEAYTQYYAVQSNTEYTGVVSDHSGLAAESITAHLYWCTSNLTQIVESNGTAVTDSTTAWTQATVTATSPSNAAYAILIFSWTATGTTDTKYLDECGLFLGSQTTWSAGGFVGSQYAVIQYSDNGGTTWQPFVRNGSQVTLSPSFQQGTVTDYEAPPLATRTYQAYVVASGLAGPVSLPASAQVSLSSWWLKDPLNPSANQTLIVSDTPQTNQLEQSTVNYPLGTGLIYPTVQAGSIGGDDGTVPATIIGQANYAAFRALISAQHVLLLQSAYGQQWYIRGALSTSSASLTQEQTQLNASSGAQPFRTVSLSYVEVGLVAVPITS